MENLIEKLKTIDKKVWIGVGIGAAVVIILIIALVIGLGNNKTAGGKGNSQNGTETEGGVTEVFGTEDVTEVLGTETTETEMGTETEMTESESESKTQGVGGTTVTQNPDVNGVTQKPTTTTQDGQEILGVGTAANPYEVIPNLNTMTVTTVAVPAGQTLYYSIRGAGNMWLSINDSAAFVIESNGTRHNASGGSVGFTVEDAMASDYVLFQIGNSGSTAKSFTIKLSNIKGSWQNPEKITTAGQYQRHLPAGEEVGYHYKYVAEKSGTIRFYITAESTKCGLTVTNNSNMAQRTFQAEVQEDAKGRYVELEKDWVQAGDEIIIILCAEKYRGEIPAADVTWEIVYVE